MVWRLAGMLCCHGAVLTSSPSDSFTKAGQVASLILANNENIQSALL